MAEDRILVGHGSYANAPGFVQQGQVDWVAFGRTVYQASLAVMQRLAAAGVQPLTHGGGMALASRFHMPVISRRRMHEAISSLRSYPAFDYVIFFGFGYRGFVNLLAETQSGMNCLALCSCLVDTHNEELAAWVLGELWTCEKFPKEYEPSYSQSLALVKACAGVITGTSFGQTVYLMLGEGQKLNVTFAKSASGAQDIAKALISIFSITRGDTESVTIMGGFDCAFIAAFAYWLLGLSVWVEDEDSNLIFAGTSNKDVAQVKVQYYRLDQAPPMQMASSTYVLGHHKDMLAYAEQATIFDLVARTSWEGCLGRVFGLAFQKLMSLSNFLGQFLGCAARIAEAFATGEAKGYGFDCCKYINFAEASYGKGFLENATVLFPELDRAPHLKEQMQLAEAVSFDEARKSIEQTLRTLKGICGCLGCSPLKPPVEDLQQNKNRGCLVAIAAVIKRLVSVLSCVEKDSELQLTVSGFESIYEELYWSWAIRSEREQNLHPGVLELQRDEHYYMFDDVHILFRGTSYQSIHRLEQPTRNWDYCTATSQNGVCIYLDALRSLSSRGELMRKLHVRRGHIQFNDRHYDSVWDAISWSNDINPIVKCEEASESILSSRHSSSRLPIKAFVTEKSSGSRLHFYYRATLPRNEYVCLQPGLLTEAVLRNTGNLSCSRWGCSNTLAFPCTPIRDGWVVDDGTLSRDLNFHAGIACCVWLLGGDEVAKCVAIQMIRDRKNASSPDEELPWTNTVFIRRKECLPCCSSGILMMSDQLLARSVYAPAERPARAVAFIIT